MHALHKPVPGEGGDANEYPWKCALFLLLRPPCRNGEIPGVLC